MMIPTLPACQRPGTRLGSSSLTASPSNFVPKLLPSWCLVYRSNVRGVLTSTWSSLPRISGI